MDAKDIARASSAQQVAGQDRAVVGSTTDHSTTATQRPPIPGAGSRLNPASARWPEPSACTDLRCASSWTRWPASTSCVARRPWDGSSGSRPCTSSPQRSSLWARHHQRADRRPRPRLSCANCAAQHCAGDQRQVQPDRHHLSQLSARCGTHPALGFQSSLPVSSPDTTCRSCQLPT